MTILQSPEEHANSAHMMEVGIEPQTLEVCGKCANPYTGYTEYSSSY